MPISPINGTRISNRAPYSCRFPLSLCIPWVSFPSVSYKVQFCVFLSRWVP